MIKYMVLWEKTHEVLCASSDTLPHGDHHLRDFSDPPPQKKTILQNISHHNDQMWKIVLLEDYSSFQVLQRNIHS